MNHIGLSVVADSGFGRATAAKETSSVGTGSKPSAVAETGKTLPQDVAASPVSLENLQQAAAELNRFVQGEQRDLMFEVNEDTGQVVVQVVDRKSGDLIRQIPNEVVLELAVRVRQNEPLQLFSQLG